MRKKGWIIQPSYLSLFLCSTENEILSLIQGTVTCSVQTDFFIESKNELFCPRIVVLNRGPKIGRGENGKCRTSNLPRVKTPVISRWKWSLEKWHISKISPVKSDLIKLDKSSRDFLAAILSQNCFGLKWCLKLIFCDPVNHVMFQIWNFSVSCSFHRSGWVQVWLTRIVPLVQSVLH